MNKGRFRPGQSGNPSGRPPKSRALSDLLASTIGKTILVDGKRIAGKKLLAGLVVEGLTTGKIQFPNEDKPSQLGMRDWIEFVKWFYQYVEPPVQKHELGGEDGGPIQIKGMTDEQILAELKAVYAAAAASDSTDG